MLGSAIEVRSVDDRSVGSGSNLLALEGLEYAARSERQYQLASGSMRRGSAHLRPKEH